MQHPPTDQVHFHNVAEFEPAAAGGTYLRRFPRAVRKALSPLGRMVSEESAGVELRFVTESDHFCLSLGAEPSRLDPYESNPLTVTLFRGDFLHSQRTLMPGRVNHIQVTDIPGVLRERFGLISPEALRNCAFPPNVWRVFLGRFPATFIDLSANHAACRAPLSTEMPARRWLAYGSSITNGASPTGHHLAYIYQAARHLGIDVYNQGLSGSCLCEPEMADYLATRDDWDLITLEIGVNMRREFMPEKFRERAQYLVGRIARAHPGKPVAVISIYPNADLAPYGHQQASDLAKTQAAYVEVLREIVAQGPGNLHLIDGATILGDFRNLSIDLIHPSDFGHIEMGRALAGQLRPLLKIGPNPAA
jgi:lysophospholipase L1-like esterase